MADIDFHDLGAYELMLLLHELHKMGYQKLRWTSYMSPNGCALRCHIATKDNIDFYGEPVMFSHDVCFASSVGQMTSGHDIKPYIDLFTRQYHELLNKGKGSDEDYVTWFNGLLQEAKKGNTPKFHGEFWSLPVGKIEVGSKMYPAPPMTMRIISWNIDGIKAHFNDLKKLITQYSPDLICLQKVKDIKNSKEFELDGYVRHCNAGPYSGVVTYSKRYMPCSHSEIEGNTAFTGHLIQTKIIYPNLTLLNVYTPYSNPQVDGAIDARRMFDFSLQRLVANTADRMIICGDMNIVHTEQDCWDGKYLRNQANFQNWERENFEQLLAFGNLIDTYRVFNHRSNEYSYFFRNDPKVRVANQGHRIDYFLASKSLEPQITRSEIIKDCKASANNPILLEFKY